MTIICFRDGVMAADSGVTSSGVLVSTGLKVRRLAGGGLFACAGASSRCLAFERWAEQGFPRDEPPFTLNADEHFTALCVWPDGKRALYHGGDRWSPIEFRYTAIGFAWEFATGAMAAGASAKRAVQLAIKHHDGCYGPVQVERLGG